MGRIWLTVQPYAARSQNPNGVGAYGGTVQGSSWTPPVFWHGSSRVQRVALWMLTIGETRSLLPFEFPAACTRTIWPVSLPANVPRVGFGVVELNAIAPRVDGFLPPPRAGIPSH